MEQPTKKLKEFIAEYVQSPSSARFTVGRFLSEHRSLTVNPKELMQQVEALRDAAEEFIEAFGRPSQADYQVRIEKDEELEICESFRSLAEAQKYFNQYFDAQPLGARRRAELVKVLDQRAGSEGVQ